MECGTHAFGLGDVARIAHNFGVKEGITTQPNLPFVRHPNSIAVLFTHISVQSTQLILWVPLVPFLFGNVHTTFCPQTRNWPRVAYDPVHFSKCILPSSGVGPVQLNMYTAVLQAASHSSFGKPLAWSIEQGLSTIVRFCYSAASFCSVVYGMVSRCVIPYSSNTFCTAS
jgi:hypothetical protein